MDLVTLYSSTMTGGSDPACDSYYCSTCGGQASRVERVLKRTSIDDLFNYVMSVDVAKYLLQDTSDEERMFLKHLVEGADWSEPLLTVQQRDSIFGSWQKQHHGNEYRQLDAIFDFVDYTAYQGRNDYFDIDTVMSKHGGECLNREGQTVRIVSSDNDTYGGFPILGAIYNFVAKMEELEEYRIDGSHFSGYWGADLVMPDTED